LESRDTLDGLISLDQHTGDQIYRLINEYASVNGYVFVLDEHGRVHLQAVLPEPLFPAQGCTVLQPGDRLIVIRENEYLWHISRGESP
ncbi:MAG: hypothetical protein NXI07_10105, partial [bacterium]|nr:hypothetical protein [bacterium]